MSENSVPLARSAHKLIGPIQPLREAGAAPPADSGGWWWRWAPAGGAPLQRVGEQLAVDAQA